jgi:phosphoserine phosphatase
LSQSCAFSDSFADIPMLTAVGFPVATNRHRAFAGIRNNWPILELRESSSTLPPFLKTSANPL